MEKVSIGYFFDPRSKKKIIQEDGNLASVFTVGLHFTVGEQRSRRTGPYVPNKTVFEKAKKKKLDKNDTIETVRHDRLKLIKFKMETAKQRLQDAVDLVPDHRLSLTAIGAIIDEAKKIHELIFSEPDIPFNPAEIVSQALKIPVEMLNRTIPQNRQLGYVQPTPLPQAQSQYLQVVQEPSAQLSVRAQNHQMTEEEAAEMTEAIRAAIVVSNDVATIEKEVANDPSHPLYITSETRQVLEENTRKNMTTRSIIDKNGNLIYTPCEPRANFFDWFIATRPNKNGPKSKKAYPTVIKAMVRYFKERAELEMAAGIKPSLLYINKKPWLPFTALQNEKVFWDMQSWFLLKGCIKKGKKDRKTKKVLYEATTRPMEPTTIKTYMGYVQASFKKAVKAGLILDTMNPHGRDGYVLPIPKKVDRSLSLEDLQTLWNYQPKDERKVKYTEKLALDYFFMSYHSNGMNICDIARLRWYQVYFGKDELELKGEEAANYNGKDERYFEFIRSKIKSKRNTFETVRVDITPEVEPYMAEYCNKEYHPENYVFPIIQPKRGPDGEYLPLLTGLESNAERDAIIEEEYRQIHNFLMGINRVLNRIAEKEIGKHIDLTTYFARHTVVNELEEIGMGVSAIQKRLGQNSRASYDYYNNRREFRKECEKSRTLADRLHGRTKEKPAKAAA